MKNFEYYHPATLEQATRILAAGKGDAKPLAGGVDLIGEMKDYIESPSQVVNLKSIKNLDYIKDGPEGLRLGPLVLLTDLENHSMIRQRFPAISQAAASVASEQIRNQGTLGGNLNQRPRCWYYRSPVHHCLKKGGDTCFSILGENKYNAIFGGGPSFIVHPSDLAPALIALNADVVITGANGKPRTIPLEEFFILPTEDVLRETVLTPGELVTEIIVPRSAANARSAYLKFKEKASMDFALSSAAASLVMENGVCKDARVVLGGVAPIPWRSQAAEAALKGQPVNAETAQRAGTASTEGAFALSDNGYKIPLTQTVVKRAILTAAGVAQPDL